MIQRINNYLLTHYPLIWNTRLLWILSANLLLHLFFFLGGLSAITVGSISRYYSVGSVGDFGMNALSFLCSLLVLIVWCVFYLRNNAFKNFYRIGKWWLAKEFLFLFFLMGTTITYFMSFNWGVRVRVRSITSQQQLLQEANAVNTAAVYLPYERSAYFILNTCAERDKADSYNGGQIEINGVDTAAVDDEAMNGSISDDKRKQDARIREAMRRPDAFSYLHYCKTLAFVSGSENETTVSNRNKLWLQQGRKDSVQAAMEALFTVLKKYRIDYRLSADTTLREVFSDSFFSVNMVIAYQPFTYQNGYEVPNPFYMESDELNKALHLVEDCQLTAPNLSERFVEWQFICYASLGLSILLLCYRRFSRKVFLISVVGTLVWAVVIGLLTLSSGEGESFFVILLFLSALFPGIGLWLLQQKSNKTLTGVLLNWHVYITPFIIPCIIALIQFDYSRNYNNSSDGNYDEFMRQHHPIGYWVEHHYGIIFCVNLIISFVYVALLFNRWAKQWQAAPEE